MSTGSFVKESACNTSNCRKIAFVCISISITIFLIYSNSLDCSWQLDDLPNITTNPNLHIKEINSVNIGKVLHSDRNNPNHLYRPIAALTFALNFYFGKLEVFGYHLLNTLIHLAAAIFLFLFIEQLLLLPSIKNYYASRVYDIAILAAFLWAINAVHTQAVTYIVQRMASLGGMFYIMSMYFYLKGRDVKERSGKIIYPVFCILSFIFALGSKENTILVPLSLIALEVFLMNRDHPMRIPYFGQKKTFIIAVIALSILSSLFFMIYWVADSYEGRPFSLSQRILTEPRILLFYLSLLFYPVPNRLNIAHSIQVSTSFFSPLSTLFSICMILAILCGLFIFRRKYPLVTFCILFFFLNHIIESTILPLELIFEHRNYIPSMLCFVPVSIGFFHVIEIYNKKKVMRFILSAFMVLILIGLGNGTYLRNYVWKTEKSLWSDALGKAPNQARVHHNLGVAYEMQGDLTSAISSYEKALMSRGIQRKDEYLATYYHLGKVYSRLEEFEKAKYYYKKAIEINPSYAPPLINLTTIYDHEGNIQMANEFLKKAVMTGSKDPFLFFNLGLYHLRTKNPDSAISHFLISLRSHELKARTYVMLGIAYKMKGSLGRATQSFQTASELNDKNILPYLHLAEIYLKTGNFSKGKEQAEAILDMAKDENLFDLIIQLIRDQGDQGDVQLSSEILFPLILEVYEERVDHFYERVQMIKNIL